MAVTVNLEPEPNGCLLRWSGSITGHGGKWVMTRIEARLAAATPGPWHWDEESEEVHSVDDRVVIDGQWWNTSDAGVAIDKAADLALILNAPQDLRDLLEIIYALIQNGTSCSPKHHDPTDGGQRCACGSCQTKR